MQEKTTSESRATLHQWRDFFFNRHAADEIFHSLLRWQVRTQVSWLCRSCVNNAITLTKVAIAISICGPVLFISFLPRTQLNNKSRFWPLVVNAAHAPRRRERLRDSTSRLQTKNCCRMPDIKKQTPRNRLVVQQYLGRRSRLGAISCVGCRDPASAPFVSC
jgi:hypothetical protein